MLSLWVRPPPQHLDYWAMSLAKATTKVNWLNQYCWFTWRAGVDRNLPFPSQKSTVLNWNWEQAPIFFNNYVMKLTKYIQLVSYPTQKHRQWCAIRTYSRLLLTVIVGTPVIAAFKDPSIEFQSTVSQDPLRPIDNSKYAPPLTDIHFPCPCPCSQAKQSKAKKSNKLLWISG